MENQHSNHGKRAMLEQELVRGRDVANQLLEVLVVDVEDNMEIRSTTMLPLAEDLARKVLRSFTNTLLLLTANDNAVSGGAAMPAVGIRDLALSTNCPKSEDTDETCKTTITFTTKNRYKRKSIAPTWEEDSSILCEDGHEWRKYGQKKTANSKYLRSYYRCSYKNEQGCQARKHVQRIQEDPPLHRTTYYGHHTCKSPLINLEHASSSPESCTLLSFSNALPSELQAQPFSSSTKQEPVEVIPDDHVAHNQLSSSSVNDNLHLLCDYELDFNYESHVSMFTTGLEFDG